MKILHLGLKQLAWVFLLAVEPGTFAGLRAQQVPPVLRQFLAANLQFGEEDFRNLGSAKPVAKLLETQHKGEVAGVGAIRIGVPLEFFLEQSKDILRYKRAQANPPPEIGTFSTPPKLADVESLALDERDIESLRDCRPGRCGVKLSAAAIERFAREIRWDADGVAASANRLFREFVLARAQGYLRSGDLALEPYHDKSLPVSIVAEFHDLLGKAPYLPGYAPRLVQCLTGFPRCDRSVQHFLYWSKEKFGHGLRPVISVSQVMVDRQGAGGNGWVWQASKQIYANHYLESSLGLTLMAEASGKQESSAFYLVYLNFSRADVLRGRVASLVQRIIQGGIGDEMTDRLERIRQHMESLWATRRAKSRQPS